LNGDGVYEWTAIDASWEQSLFCHGCSPASESVLAWNGTEYVDASTRFGDAIVATRSDPPDPPAGSACIMQDQFLSDLVGRYLDYWNAGRGSSAAAIRDRIRAFPFDAKLVGKRDAILAALALDPHYPPSTTNATALC
jgi:hypothetical protein